MLDLAAGSRLALLLTVCVFPAGVGAQSEDDGTEENRRLLRARWMASDEQLLVAPHYSIRHGIAARLLLVSRFAEAIDYELRAVSRSGMSFPLGSDSLDPREVVEIDLNDALSLAAPSFREGSLEIAYHGDPEMTQAWVLLSSEQSILALPLTKVSAFTARTLTSFWSLHGTAAGAGSEASFVVKNHSNAPIVLDLSWIGGDGEQQRRRRALGGLQSARLRPPSKLRAADLGRLVLHHDGAAGQVSMTGLLLGGGLPVKALAVSTPSELRGNHATESLTSPAAELMEVVVDLLDTRQSGSFASAEIQVIHAQTGVVLARAAVQLLPGEVASVPIHDLYDQVPTLEPQLQTRMRIRSEHGQLVARGTLRSKTTWSEFALIPTTKAHASGTYPLPSLETHEVSTTLVNLGDEEAQIFGHFASSRGEHSFEPFSVPAGAAYTIDFNSLAAQEEPDRLGRRFEADFERGFFQWFSRRGSKLLIARTEVKPSSRSTRFGFNCFGCCHEIPRGEVSPSSITFDIGENPQFETIEFVDTCAGPTGPFYAFPDSLTYATPLSWNGQYISSTDYTDQTVSFSSSGEYMSASCTTQTRTIFGVGDAVVDRCQKTYGMPGFDPKKACAVQTPRCSSCYSCCDQQKLVAYCRCDKVGGGIQCKATARHACGKCKEQCFGTHLTDCSQQITTCPV